MTKLGFLISHLGGTQLSFSLITQARTYFKDHIDIDLIAFLHNFVRPFQTPPFATMNINEAYDYDGFVIATCLDTAEKMLKFPGPRKRFFYVWDLEWMRHGGYTYEHYLKIYANPRLQLLARHADHAKAIENAWNRAPLEIIEDCNLEQLMRMVNAKN